MSKPTKNTNCLAGYACPKCGQTEQFRIEAKTMAVVTDDGVEDYGDMEWGDESYCECAECSHYGTVATFTSKEAEP